ncbi:MAG: hypothetical protein K2O95_05130, partial [Clostridia bacterium]|nr:hypothetical protein [Clostridia bacterium]
VNMENKTKIIKIKQSIGWNLAFYFLQLLYGFPEIMNDEYFYERFEELFKYTCDKISTPDEGEITDIYVVVEQRVDIN